MKYTLNQNDINYNQIHELYTIIGWNKNKCRTVEKIEESFKNSFCYVTVQINKEIVAFARIVGDGVFIFQVVDLIVHPNYRNQKIASNILKTLNKHLSNKAISVMLVDGSNISGFYQKFGFKEAKDEKVFYKDLTMEQLKK